MNLIQPFELHALVCTSIPSVERPVGDFCLVSASPTQFASSVTGFQDMDQTSHALAITHLEFVCRCFCMTQRRRIRWCGPGSAPCLCRTSRPWQSMTWTTPKPCLQGASLPACTRSGPDGSRYSNLKDTKTMQMQLGSNYGILGEMDSIMYR